MPMKGFVLDITLSNHVFAFCVTNNANMTAVSRFILLLFTSAVRKGTKTSTDINNITTSLPTRGLL